MTHLDFTSYKAKIHEPVSTFYHGKKIWTAPLPASGPVLLSIFNILEGYDSYFKEEKTTRNVHR